MLKTNVFAGSINNLTDARYFAARGAQYLSFDLDPGLELSINAEKVAAIQEWVEGSVYVGAFHLATIDDIQFMVDRLNLQLVQTGPFIPIENLKEQLPDISLIREVIVERLDDLSNFQTTMESLTKVFDFIFFNFEKNRISWSALKKYPDSCMLLKNWASHHKLILSITHAPSETQEIIDIINPYGLYLKGGEEEKVGFKSFDELDDILDVLEVEE